MCGLGHADGRGVSRGEKGPRTLAPGLTMSTRLFPFRKLSGCPRGCEQPGCWLARKGMSALPLARALPAGAPAFSTVAVEEKRQQWGIVLSLSLFCKTVPKKSLKNIPR